MIVPPRMIQKVFLLDFINPLTIVSDLQKQVFAIPHGTSNMQNTAIRTCELTFWFSSRDHSQRFSLDPDRIVDRGAVHAGSSAAVHVEIMFIIQSRHSGVPAVTDIRMCGMFLEVMYKMAVKNHVCFEL